MSSIVSHTNPFHEQLYSSFQVNGINYNYYNINKLNDPRIAKVREEIYHTTTTSLLPLFLHALICSLFPLLFFPLLFSSLILLFICVYISLSICIYISFSQLPYSIRVLLESAVRNADNFAITEKDVKNICGWVETSTQQVEIPFKPARVLMQDFTGVPAVVDLAAMREAMHRLGGDANKINPLVPADLVVDHSVQVDYNRTEDALRKNLAREMERNKERFQFLKWGSKSLQNFLIVPPGSGIVHQVNLEFLARVVFQQKGKGRQQNESVVYPDSVVGTDSHTTMINGLGVTGWGVGGIEAEAVMLGQPISMVLPEVIGYRLIGRFPPTATATDLVLTITEKLRARGVVDKFVEFFGPGLSELSLADRATIANMAPEYGATMGFFPVDGRTIDYLRNTGRDEQKVQMIEAYLRAQNMFLTGAEEEASYTAVMELDLSTIVPSVAGPKRPHDRVAVSTLASEFTQALTRPVGFKGYGLPEADVNKSVELQVGGKNYTLKHGSVVIAAITSCTNTSNPSVMLGAALLAKKAVERGLTTPDYVKTSLAPGSGVVQKYLERSGLQPYMNQLGFSVVGYGCTTCIGNSGDIAPEVSAAIDQGDLVAAAVLSGNRNFEGRVHPQTRANYLASPPLVVAYAIAGNVNIDFDTQPLGQDKEGKNVFLRDIWPTNAEIQEVVGKSVVASMFKEVYANIQQGGEEWNALPVSESLLYQWDPKSTYIHHPPFFQSMTEQLPVIPDIKEAFCLLNLGDSITTDHISPAGDIAKNSPAAKFLQERGVAPKDFNTYGSRRGNDEVMARGTFANIRLINKLAGKAGPNTLHVPSKQMMPIFDAADQYKKDGKQVIVLAGKDYGSGSSRDWAAKGPFLQGVRAVICISFERIHRSNLVGMGILPLVFTNGEDADKLGLTGQEQFSIDLTSQPLSVGQLVDVKVSTGKSFKAKVRLDTEVELAYFKHGGILPYVVRKLLAEGKNKD